MKLKWQKDLQKSIYKPNKKKKKEKNINYIPP